eukprot:m.181313 g.181313  ORF g.181313 m.181313 type:complete len:249 (-) comp15230_c0_seq1:35-781(-)
MLSRNAASRLGLGLSTTKGGINILESAAGGGPASPGFSANSRVRPVVLVCDMSTELMSLVGGAVGILRAVNAVVDWATQHRVPIIYTRIELDGLGALPTAGNHRLLKTLQSEGMVQAGSPGAALHPELSVPPTAYDLVRPKLSPFFATPLDALLRTHGCTDVVITGISTSGAVLAASRDAADRDYTTTVLSDTVGNSNSRAHRTVLEHVLPIAADVVTSASWMAHTQQRWASEALRDSGSNDNNTTII